MTLLRKTWVLGSLMVPMCAVAHSPIKGIMPFYGGMAHPFVVPAHIIAIVAFGLLMGQNAKAAVSEATLSLLITLVLGLSLSGILGDPDTDLPLLATSATIALAVSWARPVRPVVIICAAAVLGLLMGLGSGPEGLAGSKRWITLAGTCLGVCVGTVWMTMLAEYATRPWQKVAMRVVSSWIAAAAVLVLALTWVGPKTPPAAASASEVPPSAANIKR